MFLWQNESCLLHVANHVLHFRRRKKQGVRDKWCIPLGFRDIGDGHATALKVFSFLGLYTLWLDVLNFSAISASKCSYFVLKILCSLMVPNVVIPYCTVLHCGDPDLQKSVMYISGRLYSKDPEF